MNIFLNLKSFFWKNCVMDEHDISYWWCSIRARLLSNYLTFKELSFSLLLCLLYGIKDLHVTLQVAAAFNLFVSIWNATITPTKNLLQLLMITHKQRTISDELHFSSITIDCHQALVEVKDLDVVSKDRYRLYRCFQSEILGDNLMT